MGILDSPIGATIFILVAIAALIAAALLEPRKVQLRSRLMPRLVLRSIVSLTGGAALTLVYLRLGAQNTYAMLISAQQLPPVANAEDALRAGGARGLTVVFGCIAIAIAGIGWIYFAPAPWSRRGVYRTFDQYRRVTGRAERLMSAIPSVITTPVVEELLLRAVFPTVLFWITGNAWIGFGLSVIGFALVYVPSGLKTALYFVSFGLVTTVVYVVTGNIAFAIGIHAFANLGAFVLVPEIQAAAVRQAVARAIDASRSAQRRGAPPPDEATSG